MDCPRHSKRDQQISNVEGDQGRPVAPSYPRTTTRRGKVGRSEKSVALPSARDRHCRSKGRRRPRPDASPGSTIKPQGHHAPGQGGSFRKKRRAAKRSRPSLQIKRSEETEVGRVARQHHQAPGPSRAGARWVVQKKTRRLPNASNRHCRSRSQRRPRLDASPAKDRALCLVAPESPIATTRRAPGREWSFRRNRVVAKRSRPALQIRRFEETKVGRLAR